MMLLLYAFAEATARLFMGLKRKTDDELELNHEDINPDYKLESYILSVLNVSKGVFSESSTISRAWYEISCEHPWFSLFKSEVNGPATAKTNSVEVAKKGTISTRNLVNRRKAKYVSSNGERLVE